MKASVVMAVILDGAPGGGLAGNGHPSAKGDISCGRLDKLSRGAPGSLVGSSVSRNLKEQPMRPVSVS
jgi:hypothetical protein